MKPHAAACGGTGTLARTDWLLPVCLVLLCALGLGLRILQLGREGFWLDEIFAASYTALNLWETLIAVLRFDLHPPLYYWQLNLWSWLGHGDVWLLLNSSLWSTASLLLLVWTAWRREGPVAGLFVAALAGACSTEVFYAGELRMYAMLSCLVVLGWLAADRYVQSYQLRRAGATLLLVLLALALSHSMGLLAVSALLIYTFPWSRHAAQLRSWAWLPAMAALFLLPWLLNASFRSVSHTSAFSFQEGLVTLGAWAGAPNVVGGTVVVVLIAWLLSVPRWRRFVGSFVVWPLLFIAIASLLLRPVWIPRIFVFCALMFWYALAVQLATVWGQFSRKRQLSTAWSAPLALLLATGLAISALATVLQPHKAEYREAAADIRAEQGAGSFVYIPKNILFWGIARYLVGPEWGNLLRIQDPQKPDQSERWSDIYARLGTDRLHALELMPETRVLPASQPPLVIGWSDYAPLAFGNYWVVTDYALELDSLPLCASRSVTTRNYRGIRVHRIACGAVS